MTQGRSRLQRAFRFAWAFNQAMTARNIGLLSAGVAFFSLLAVFPGIAALISVFGLFADPLVLQDQLAVIEDLIPQAAYTLLRNQITRLIWANEGVLGWTSLISVLIALFLARRGVDAMLIGINAIHGTPRRKGLAHAMRVLVITLGMLMAGIVAMLSVLIMPVVLTVFPLFGSSALLVETSRWALTLGLVGGWIWVFYRIGPNRKDMAHATMFPGLLLAVTLWITASMGLSYYLSNFGNYNEIYGSIGAFVALLMWFYISAYAVLLGGILNATLEQRSESKQSAIPMSDETDLPETE